MAIDTHIKFDGIEGESAHKDHKGSVAVLSWSWGLSKAAAAATGAGTATGKTVPQEMRIVHRYDKASPLLAKQAVQGKHLGTAVLTARKAGEGQKDFLKITMKEVVITSVQASEGGEGPIEEVALSYGSIDFEYRPQDSKGSLGNPVPFNWNVKTGRVS